jgi:peptidoglycan/LPS O-acetylase OafA/YrhL
VILSNNKNTAFEMFRALAVTMVLVGHFAALTKDFPIIAKNIIGSFQLYGLSMFFIISGFLLSASFTSLLKKHNQIWIAVKIFFIKRILRIYPAYIVSLIVFSALLTKFFKYPVYWFDLFVHFFNIHNLFAGFNESMNAVYWTLAVEFQWYLFAPLLILLFIKTNIKTQIVLFSASILLSVFMRFSAINDYFKQMITYAEMVRLGYEQLYIHLYNFLFGIAMYRWRDQKLKIHSSIVYLLLSLFIVIGYIIQDPDIMTYGEAMYIIKGLLGYTGIFILGIMMFVFINFELHGKFYQIISFISLISYSLYIYHFPVLYYVKSYFSSWYIILPVFLSCSVCIAAISYYIIEAPFLKYSSKLGRFR